MAARIITLHRLSPHGSPLVPHSVRPVFRGRAPTTSPGLSRAKPRAYGAFAIFCSCVSFTRPASIPSQRLLSPAGSSASGELAVRSTFRSPLPMRRFCTWKQPVDAGCTRKRSGEFRNLFLCIWFTTTRPWSERLAWASPAGKVQNLPLQVQSPHWETVIKPERFWQGPMKTHCRLLRDWSASCT